MSKIRKRLIAFALAIAMAVTLVPWIGGTNVVEANAASLTKDEVNSRINYICSQLEGKVFGVDQNNGCGYKSTNPNHNYAACYNCANYNVIEAGWFQAAFGSVSINQFPEYATPGGGTMSRRADSCAGFASFAEWAIFNGGSGDSVTTYKVGEGAFTYDYMSKNARLGDIIRIRDMGHSAIVLEVNPSGCYVLDCNWTDGGSLPNSIVRRHTIGWDGYDVVAISRTSCDIVEYNPVPLNRASLGQSFTAAMKNGDYVVKDANPDVYVEPGAMSLTNVWWDFTRNSNGSYSIRSRATDHYLDDWGAAGDNGNRILTYTGNGSAAQHWFIYDGGNGTIVLEPECAPGRVFDLGGEATSTGRKAHLWQYSANNNNQHFTLVYNNVAPTLTNAVVSEITSDGYKVECDFSDDLGVEKVEMPTWTSIGSNHGQDDLQNPWPRATVSNGHATIYIKTSDHNNEYGEYNTHIYVWDISGNKKTKSLNGIQVPKPGEVAKSYTFTAPQKEITQGTKLNYGGTLTSNVAIQSVTLAIYQNTDSTTTAVVEKTVNPAAKSYTLTNALYDGSALAAGGYTLKLTAKTASGTTTLLEQPLLVKATGATIPDGEYVAKVAGNKNVVISVENESTENGANVAAATDNGEEYQKFKIEYLGDGYYSIVNTNSGMALAVKGAGTTSGTTVIQATKNTSDSAQKWQILPTAAETYCLVPACATGLVVDLYGGKCQAGDNINISNMHFGANQRFYLEPTVRCDVHTWDSGKLIKAATCTEDGEMKYTCRVCKFSEIRTIEAKGHTRVGEASVSKEPTRFEDGIKEYTCTTCGELIQEPFNVTWVDTINLNNTSAEIEVGSTAKLQANTSPSDAVETGIIWQSSDEDVATVTADGTVTAVGVGEATITASAADSFPPTTEYRYRTIVDYETKTTTTKGSLGEGWEYVSEKTDTTYGAWGPWSGWSRTAPNPGASDTRKVETRTVPVYETQYDYDKWAQYSDGTGWSGPWEGYWSGIYCGNYIRRGWSSSRLSLYKQEDGINFYGRSGDTWYGEYSQQAQVGSYTEYRYCDRTKTVTTTYTYRRPIWSDWSAWSATPEEAASNKEIETRDVTGSGQATVSASCKVTVKPLKLIGWKDVEGGKAYYVNNERVTGIQKIDGVKYIFNEDGIMQTGWYTLDGKTYYMATDGAVQYGALKIKVGGVLRIFYFDKYGVKQDGFITIKGSTYYFDAVNGMLKGSKKIGKDWYYFNSKGVMQTGWITSSGKTFYFKEDGTRAKGLLEIDGKKYYFGSNGVMTIGWLEKSGKKFYFNADGSMQFGWKKLNNKYYFFNGKGVMVTGWLQKKGNWYYLQDDGTALMNGTLTVGPKTYVFDSKGICQNP